MKKLRAYQEHAVERFTNAPEFCLNFDCGVGKTLTTAAIAQEKQLPTIIIAPKSICDQWRDELLEMGVPTHDIMVYDKPTETKNPQSYHEEYDQWLNR